LGCGVRRPKVALIRALTFPRLDICITGASGRQVWSQRCFSRAAEPTWLFVAQSFQEGIDMSATDLPSLYRGYIACLNAQDWPHLADFVDDRVIYNGLQIGLSGYREMLEKDFHDIPDLWFNIRLLVADPPHIACRLQFNCSPKHTFLGLSVNGKKISFTENVFYEFRDGKIAEVWSVIDKAAIEAQL
jgi:predicted ester cyclase